LPKLACINHCGDGAMAARTLQLTNLGASMPQRFSSGSRPRNALASICQLFPASPAVTAP
jgi:hypothetical protein